MLPAVALPGTPGFTPETAVGLISDESAFESAAVVAAVVAGVAAAGATVSGAAVELGPLAALEPDGAGLGLGLGRWPPSVDFLSFLSFLPFFAIVSST